MAESFSAALRRLRTAAGLSQSELARRVYVSSQSMSRYESGLQGCGEHTAELIDRELGAGGQLQDALADPGPLNSDQRARVAYGLAHPSRVDVETVNAIADSLAAQRRLDDVTGPALLIPATVAQADMVTTLLRGAEGPARDKLAAVAGEFVQFSGWLHAEDRRDREAVHLLTDAELLADEADDGTLAAQALNFKGYLARQQGRPQAMVRWFLAAFHTPGAHVSQRIGDAVQAAAGFAQLGDRDAAERLLDDAGRLLDQAAREAPPRTAYWLSPTYHRLNIGLAHLALGEPADAAEHLAAGLDGLPEGQRQATWAGEYRRAFEQAVMRR